MVARQVAHSLTRSNLSNIIDTTGTSIGKRYARTDELGVPFAITVDYDTLKDGTVTVRERDTTAQVRVQSTEVASVIRKLVDGEESWADVQAKYPAHTTAEN